MPKKLTFCPICGHTLTTREEGGRLRPACENCGYVHYVNPVPGVGLLIEMNGGVVLIQRGNPPHKGEWTLPSGFVEADESAEEAAIREAEEETGLQVEIIELMGINSFPEGPPVSGIMIFYRLRPIGGQLQSGDDAADVRVFMPAEMPLLPFRTHREIMAEWLEKYHHGMLNQANPKNPPPEFIIRPFEMTDLEHILGLVALIPANRNLTDEQWRMIVYRLRESRDVEVFVAQTQTTPPMIVGCIALSIVRGLTEGRGLINDMAVLPTYQRRGIGAELLEAVMRRASQLGLSSLMVNTQRANDQARAFYARLGVVDAGIMMLKIK
ncbi:MAG: GNAT family N-acetyltransferase [Anaerolineae bacterium]|nr:GNAT family N-acetyltransferase [Anaerolineae bacterium]